MDCPPEELLEARRQLESLRHKLEATLTSLRAKAGNGARLRSQITLAERRLRALDIAIQCISAALPIDCKE